jgi:hypothetical protein
MARMASAQMRLVRLPFPKSRKLLRTNQNLSNGWGHPGWDPDHYQTKYSFEC